MDKRQEELTKLKSYTEKVDNDLTMILQSLHWDRKHLLQTPVLDICRYDSNHKIPPEITKVHEEECFLRENGYTKEDQLLPEPLDADSNTLVKLRKEDIQEIITNAARADVTLKKVYRTNGGSILAHAITDGCHGAEPLSLERLQVCYSADERRVIHDAVVSAVPSCHDLADLALPSESNEQGSKVILSRKEILLELRNMRRRRTKYRVAPKTRNYSDVLRDVIRTQMEVYNDGKTEETTSKGTSDSHNDDRNRSNSYNRNRYDSHNDYRNRQERSKKRFPQPMQIKTEREEPVERDRIENSRHSRRHSNDNERHRQERKKWEPRPIEVEIKTERDDFTERDARTDRRHSQRDSKYDDRHKHEHSKKGVPRPIKVEVETETEGTRRRRDSEYDSEDRHERNEDSVPRSIKEEIRSQREGSTERNRSSDRRQSSQDLELVPEPIKEDVKTKRKKSETPTQHKRDRSHKTNRDDISRRDKRNRNSRRDHSPRESRYYEENYQERTQNYGEHYRKRRSDHGYEEHSHTRERQNYYDDGEYRSKTRHKRSHRHDDYDFESERRKESQPDDESHGEKRDSRRKDKDRRRQDKHTHRNDDSGWRHREEAEGSRQKPSDSIRIKLERADSVTLRDAAYSCDDETNRDRNRGDHRRYYDDSDTQNVYNPNKKIKTEK